MYFCSCCGKPYEKEEKLVQHFSKCWKEKNPCHHSKDAPRSEDIVTIVNSESLLNFLERL